MRLCMVLPPIRVTSVSLIPTDTITATTSSRSRSTTRMRTTPVQCGPSTYAATFLIMMGLFLVLVWPSLLDWLINKEMSLSPTSIRFRSFKKTPVPVYLDFYFFNWTNPDKIHKEKPMFTEMGPYRFYERREKLNVTWNTNGTVSYHQMRNWFYSPAESKDINQLVTTVNPVALTIAYVMRHHGFFTQSSLNMALGFTKQRLEITRSVREFLFDGYEDNLMMIASHVPARLTRLSSPFDKFAWFYNRNGSHVHDGWFNVDTGQEDMGRLGDLKFWNYKQQTGFYSGRCGSIDGSSGELFASPVTDESIIKIFSPDLCRSMSMEYEKDVDFSGVDGKRFVTGVSFTDNGTCLPDNKCYCNGECVPSGFLNLTSCRYGAPVFVSLPHFHRVDPSVQQEVAGLSPDKNRHSFYFTIEPNFGIPLDVAARVQINMLLQPIRHMKMYAKVPRVFIPILWVDQRIILTDKIVGYLKLLFALMRYSPIVSMFVLICGVVLLSVSLLCNRSNNNKPRQKQTS